MKLVNVSNRLLPGKSGTARVLSSSTRTNPGASPLGDTSQRPAAFDELNSTMGDFSMIVRQCLSR